MLRFIVRRILFIALVWVFIVFFSNLGMRMARNSEISRPDYNLVQHGKSAWQDTRTFLSGALRGDLGAMRIPSGLAPIKDFLGESYVNSMGLLLVALVIAAILGLGIGSMAALTKRRMLVLPLLTLTILGISTPSFFAGLLLQVGELRYLAITGRRLVSMAGFGWDLEHTLMPVLVLAARLFQGALPSTDRKRTRPAQHSHPCADRRGRFGALLLEHPARGRVLFQLAGHGPPPVGSD